MIHPFIGRVECDSSVELNATSVTHHQRRCEPLAQVNRIFIFRSFAKVDGFAAGVEDTSATVGSYS